jgi:hypothetical protein
MVGKQVVSVKSHGDDLKPQIALKVATQNGQSFSTPSHILDASLCTAGSLAVTRT